MITFHFHLQPQYKYELFHINFTSFHCMGRYELNKLTSLPICGFIAQLVEHRTGIAEVTGSNPTVAQKGQTQISFPKHKSIYQNTNQFPKTQISLPEHKTISQNTKQFSKTQINFSKTQINFAKHKSKD